MECVIIVAMSQSVEKSWFQLARELKNETDPQKQVSYAEELASKQEARTWIRGFLSSSKILRFDPDVSFMLMRCFTGYHTINPITRDEVLVAEKFWEHPVNNWSFEIASKVIELGKTVLTVGERVEYAQRARQKYDLLVGEAGVGSNKLKELLELVGSFDTEGSLDWFCGILEKSGGQWDKMIFNFVAKIDFEKAKKAIEVQIAAAKIAGQYPWTAMECMKEYRKYQTPTQNS